MGEETSRKIARVILHCSASDNPKHDFIRVIREWHIYERGFTDVGYHYFIRKTGVVEKGRDESTVGAHTYGENFDSLGICLSGDYLFTPIQFIALSALVRDIQKRYGLNDSDVYPHNFYNHHKTCPNFDVDQLFNINKDVP